MSEAEKTGKAVVKAVHLDAVGGIAGDMFVAALLDAMPAAWPACQRAIDAVDPPPHVHASVAAYGDGVLTGSQFHVAGGEPHPHHDAGSHDHARHPGHDVEEHHRHDHAGHHPWREIRSRLELADLLPNERDHAIGIFSALAEAEASVHGIAVDDVAFHEVGAWDSIVDIVAAATVIAQLPNCAWSVGALPRGRGLVKSAHGMLPVPAPATVKLLQSFLLYDDGEDGERITPTGAAILRYLAPTQEADAAPRRLMATGTGFGTKRLKRRSNILRATLYGGKEQGWAPRVDVVDVLRCEIDDQTPEDLAIALGILREDADVLDACQWPVFGKKGRMAMAVQVLVRPQASARVIRLILDETTTLGVRHTTATRATLERSIDSLDGVRAKVAVRPSGRTAKAEISDLENVTTHANRQDERRRVERSVLKDETKDE